MKYFVFLALLPCILSAEVQNTLCVDGTQCAQEGTADCTKQEKEMYWIFNRENFFQSCCRNLEIPLFFFLGKYCCESGCCDLSKEMQDKGYVPAFPPSAPFNVSLLTTEIKSERMHAFCLGTECAFFCHPGNYGATCCNNPMYACPSKTSCCGDSFSEHPWCCRQNQRCSSVKNLCVNGAFTTSTAMMSMLLAFVIGITSKYFL